MDDKPYPSFVCVDCGTRYGNRTAESRHATIHYGVCDVCGRSPIPVTEPRDFGHLRVEWKTHGVKQ